MELTLAEAATLLGKSERQVRYMLRAGKLAGRKQGNRWWIDSASLPLDAAQRARLSARVAAATAAFEGAIAGSAKAAGKTRRTYSVTDLDAFRIGAEILAALRGAGHDDAAALLLQALEDLARGCHEFHPRHKRSRFTSSRDAAARAVVHLLTGVTAGAEPAALAARLEGELIPKLTGLIASQENRARRGRCGRNGGGDGGRTSRWRDYELEED